MDFSKEDFKNITKYHTVPKDQKGFIVLLGGDMFESNTGKRLFLRKHHALSALNYALGWKVKQVVRNKLEDIGLTVEEIHRSLEYICAWDNFAKQAEASGFLQVIKL